GAATGSRVLARGALLAFRSAVGCVLRPARFRGITLRNTVILLAATVDFDQQDGRIDHMFTVLDRPVPPRQQARPDRAPQVDPVVCLPAPTIADALARPDATAAALTMLEPGAESTGTLLALIPARLSNGGLIDALIATERQLATVQARQQQLLAELAQRDPDGEAYLRDEVACALRLAPATAHRKLQVAVALTGPLWDTFTGLQAGQFS